jgi:hypothetical protein
LGAAQGDSRMSVLLPVYQAYYILAGIAGLALYPFLVRLCLERFQTLWPNASQRGQGQQFAVGALLLILCSAEVQFCFARAATLIRYAAS